MRSLYARKEPRRVHAVVLREYKLHARRWVAWKWIINKNLEYVDNLSILVNGEPDVTTAALNRGTGSEKHKEFYEAALLLGVNESEMLDRCCINLAMMCPDTVSYLVDFIKNKLSE